MGASGTMRFEGEGRAAVASAIAGVLAEHGVSRLEVRDPRVCRAWGVRARECDLPGELLRAEPGTTFSGQGVALMVDSGVVRWVADGEIAARLAGLSAED